MNKKIKINIAISLLILCLIYGSFSFGYHKGLANRPAEDLVTTVDNKDNPVIDKADFSTFWKVWNIIDDKSPNAKDVKPQDRVYGAISGLMGSLNDPYSVFFNPQESKDFQDTIDGSFVGVGMEMGMKDKVLTVISPLKDTPAYKAGIKSGDKLLKIDKTTTTDMSIDTAIKLIRGEPGTTVVLTMYRDGDKVPRVFNVVRATITIPTIKTEKLDGGVFSIALYSFDANAITKFKEALTEFKQSGDTKLILDLRGNPGGYLDAAIDIASYFLPSGKTVVIEDFGTKSPAQTYRSKGYDLLGNTNIKMAILMDGGSASASEILAGALSEQKVATLIGEQSYGKGSVQELLPVTDDTSLKITIAKWLTPNGISISKQGLTPDIAIKNLDSWDGSEKTDLQFAKALEFLNK